MIDYIEPELWMQDALCAQSDPDLWFPEPHESARAGQKICLSCPVRMQCLEYAMRTHQTRGTWGGKSEFELRSVRKPAAA